MIRVVEVVELTAHPDSSALNICRVGDGQGAIEVVCGAANVRAGMRTILAEAGDRLPSGATLQVVDLRGVKSHGMLWFGQRPTGLGRGRDSGPPRGYCARVAGGTGGARATLQHPWHSYRAVDVHYWDMAHRRITVVAAGGSPPQGEGLQLISKTYFHRGRYRYRHFLLGESPWKR